MQILTGQIMAWVAAFVMLNTRIATASVAVFLLVQSYMYNLDEV